MQEKVLYGKWLLEYQRVPKTITSASNPGVLLRILSRLNKQFPNSLIPLDLLETVGKKVK